MLILYQLFFVYVQMHVCLFKVFSSIFFKSKVFHSDAGRMIEGGASTASGHDAEAFDMALASAHDRGGGDGGRAASARAVLLLSVAACAMVQMATT